MLQYLIYWTMDIMFIYSTETICANRIVLYNNRRRLHQYDIKVKTKIWDIRPRLSEIVKMPELGRWIDDQHKRNIIVNNIYILKASGSLVIQYTATDADSVEWIDAIVSL